MADEEMTVDSQGRIAFNWIGRSAFTVPTIQLRIKQAVLRYRADRAAFSRITSEQALDCAESLDSLLHSPPNDTRTDHAPYGVDRNLVISKHIQVAVGRTKGFPRDEEQILEQVARECARELVGYVERYEAREAARKEEEEEVRREKAKEMARMNRGRMWVLWMLRGILSVPDRVFRAVWGLGRAVFGVPARLKQTCQQASFLMT
jgi:hypothetical protein